MADVRRGRAMMQRLLNLSKTYGATREREYIEMEVQSKNDDLDRMACDGLIEVCIRDTLGAWCIENKTTLSAKLQISKRCRRQTILCILI